MQNTGTPSLSAATRALAAWLCLISLTGCQSMSGYPQSPQKSDTLNNLQNTYFDGKKVADYDSDTVADSRLLKRNEIVEKRIQASDMEFSLLKRCLSSENNSISVGADLLALALNGLGATTGDAATKAALAAASGGVIAANGAVNKDIFYQKTVSAVIAQMEADRAKAKATVFQGLSESDASYPLTRAEIDLVALYDAGNLNTAITNITQQSATEAQTSQAVIDTYRTQAMSSSDSTKKILTWLTKNPGNRTLLVQWWNSHAPANLVAGLPFALLITSSTTDLEKLRQQAISDLNIS